MEDEEPAICKQVRSVARELGCNFTLKGESINFEHVFSMRGLLPAVLRRADQLASFTLGYNLGITFDRADGTMLGVTAKLDNKTPTSLRLLCIADVLVELMQTAPSSDKTPLDELLLD